MDIFISFYVMDYIVLYLLGCLVTLAKLSIYSNGHMPGNSKETIIFWPIYLGRWIIREFRKALGQGCSSKKSG